LENGCDKKLKMDKIEDSFFYRKNGKDLYLVWDGNGYSGKPRTIHDIHENEYQEYIDDYIFTPWKEEYVAHYEDVLIGRYMKEGFWVIPLNWERRPVESFTKYHLAQREAMRIRAVYGGTIGVVCGGYSNGLVGLDCDKKLLPKPFTQFLSRTLVTSSPHGYHIYFRTNKTALPDDLAEKLKEYKEYKISSRFNSNYFALPLSLNEEGQVYDFIDWEAPISSLNELLEVIYDE
jgi:hypothetical protein